MSYLQVQRSGKRGLGCRSGWQPPSCTPSLLRDQCLWELNVLQELGSSHHSRRGSVSSGWLETTLLGGENTPCLPGTQGWVHGQRRPAGGPAELPPRVLTRKKTSLLQHFSMKSRTVVGCVGHSLLGIRHGTAISTSGCPRSLSPAPDERFRLSRHWRPAAKAGCLLRA